MKDKYRILMQRPNEPIHFANCFHYTLQKAELTAQAEQQSTRKAMTFTFTIIDVEDNKVVKVFPATLTDDAI